MTFPNNVDTVIVQHYWWDDATRAGVSVPVTWAPQPFSGSAAPNLVDASSHGWVKTRTWTSTPDPVTGYHAVPLTASNDPDLTGFAGYKVTAQGETPFTIAVDVDAPTVSVTAEMAAALGALTPPITVTVGQSVKAVWLTDVAFVAPSPTPPASFFTAPQTTNLVLDAVLAHDTDGHAHRGGQVALVDAPTIVTDASTGRLFTVTLGGNRTLANPTNLAAGQQVTWRVTQDAVGGRVLSLGSMFNVNPAVTGPLVWSTTPNAVDYLGGIYRDTTNMIDVLAFAPGY